VPENRLDKKICNIVDFLRVWKTAAKNHEKQLRYYIQKVSYEIANIDYVKPEERDAIVQ